jgi:phosphopantetheinyl transferase
MNSGSLIIQREQKEFKCGWGMLSADLVALNRYLHLLHPAEKEQFKQFQYEARKMSWLLGRCAAKRAIQELCPEEDIQSYRIDHGVFQFPVVKSPANHNIQVSISHSYQTGVALAFPEEHPMGIDLEKTDAARIDTIERTITGRESEAIRHLRLPRELGCTLIWTIKESLSKILKTGLTVDLQILEMDSLSPGEPGYISTFRHFPQFRACSFHNDNYVCSVTLPKKSVVCLQAFATALSRITPS